MITGNSPAHRRVLAAAATAAAICLALALVAPTAQAAPAAPARPASLAAAAVHHLPAGRTTVLHVNCTSDCLTYTICLLNDKKLCLGIWGDVEKASAIAGLIGFLIQVWQVIKNKKTGDTTDEGEGEEGGSDQGKHLCLAAAPTTSDTNDRAYVTSNCFGNKYASWYCVEVARNACNYYSVAALDQDDQYELTTLNTRDHAYAYVKPPTSGDWQKWLWSYWDTCKKNCIHHAKTPTPPPAGPKQILALG